mmetsp:Transcript_8403/g.20766  ORF Transcript_8403/g.20766 Transcript_8403/m.20766 type:complete len:205 (+) Transcript_8403:620-1234(+)
MFLVQSNCSSLFVGAEPERSAPAALLISAKPTNGFQWYGRTRSKLSGGSPLIVESLLSFAFAQTSSRSSTTAVMVPPQGNIRFRLFTSRPKSPTSVRETMRLPKTLCLKSFAFSSNSSAERSPNRMCSSFSLVMRSYFSAPPLSSTASLIWKETFFFFFGGSVLLSSPAFSVPLLSLVAGTSSMVRLFSAFKFCENSSSAIFTL